MKKYFTVSFQFSETVFCSNIAHAESAADVEAYYSKYPRLNIRECKEWELEDAKRKGMPIFEIERREETSAQISKHRNAATKDDGICR